MKTDHFTVYKKYGGKDNREYIIRPTTIEAGRELIKIFRKESRSGDITSTFDDYELACYYARAAEDKLKLCTEGLDKPFKDIIKHEEKDMSSKLFNIALFTNTDLTTIGACYDGGRKLYTFIVEKTIASQLSEGDQCMVYTAGEYKAVTIKRIDEESDIDIDAPYRYQPIVAVLTSDTHRDRVLALTEQRVSALRVQQRQALRAQLSGNLDTILLAEINHDNEDF